MPQNECGMHDVSIFATKGSSDYSNVPSVLCFAFIMLLVMSCFMQRPVQLQVASAVHLWESPATVQLQECLSFPLVFPARSPLLCCSAVGWTYQTRRLPPKHRPLPQCPLLVLVLARQHQLLHRGFPPTKPLVCLQALQTLESQQQGCLRQPLLSNVAHQVSLVLQVVVVVCPLALLFYPMSLGPLAGLRVAPSWPSSSQRSPRSSAARASPESFQTVCVHSCETIQVCHLPVLCLGSHRSCGGDRRPLQA